MLWNSSLSLHTFWVKNAKNDIFKEKRGLSAVFIEFKCRWLQTGLADSEKHQTFGILHKVMFLYILKKSRILRFFNINSSASKNCWMHFILSEYNMQNSKELDYPFWREILHDCRALPVSMLKFYKSIWRNFVFF